MSTKTTDFPTALKPVLHDVFEVTWDRPTQYTETFMIDDSQDAYEDELQIQGPDSIPAAGEGSVYERVEIENTRQKRYTHLIYKAEVRITKEALADLKYKQITDAVAKLAKAGNRTIERIAAGVFINGLNGSELAADGVAVFSASHVISNPFNGAASTASNLAATQGALSVMNVRQMRAAMRKTVDEHGSISPRMGQHLIVPPDLEDEGEAIMQSTLKPGLYGNSGATAYGAVNDKNTTGPKIKKVTVMDFLGENPTNATTAWILRDDEEAQNKVYWRVRPEKELIFEEPSGDHLFRLYMRLSAGVTDWRGLYASAGTGNTTTL